MDPHVQGLTPARRTPGEWSIVLTASEKGGATFDRAIAYASADAQTVGDRKPPSPPPTLRRERKNGTETTVERPSSRLYLARAETEAWNQYEDLPAPVAPEMTWFVELLAVEGAEISWELEGVPAEYEVTIQELGSQVKTPLDGARSREVAASETVRRFALTAVKRDVDAPKLLANFPNPFNPETWIPFELSESATVQVSIYDVGGALVRRLELGYREAGRHRSREKAAYWDGRNELGEHVASGLYIYELKAGTFQERRRMLLLK